MEGRTNAHPSDRPPQRVVRSATAGARFARRRRRRPSGAGKSNPPPRCHRSRRPASGRGSRRGCWRKIAQRHRACGCSRQAVHDPRRVAFGPTDASACFNRHLDAPLGSGLTVEIRARGQRHDIRRRRGRCGLNKAPTATAAHLAALAAGDFALRQPSTRGPSPSRAPRGRPCWQSHAVSQVTWTRNRVVPGVHLS